MEELIELFNGTEPTLPHFSQIIKHLPETERMAWTTQLFRIAFAEWKEANKAYRDFLTHWVLYHQQEFVDFFHNETVMGQLLIPVGDPELLILFFILWQNYQSGPKTSICRMLFVFSLIFELPYRLKRLRNLTSNRTIDPADLMDIYGRVRL